MFYFYLNIYKLDDSITFMILWKWFYAIHFFLFAGIQMNIHQSNTYRKDLSWLYFDLFNHLGSYRNVCSFRLVLDGKTGKVIPESWRLEFWENILTTNFSLSNAKDNTFRPWNSADIADLLLLRTLLPIYQNPREKSFREVMDSYVLLVYVHFAASRTLLKQLLFCL